MRSGAELALEVCLPRRGEVTTRDVRAVCGGELQHLQHVDLLVLDADGGVPIARSIELTEVRSGPSRRLALVCPACREARHLLLARGGALKCGTCHRYRTRRQAERTCTGFTKLGGQLEDQLLRLVVPRWRRTTPARMVEAQRLVQLLLDGDRAQVEKLRQDVSALQIVLESRQAG